MRIKLHMYVHGKDAYTIPLLYTLKYSRRLQPVKLHYDNKTRTKIAEYDIDPDDTIIKITIHKSNTGAIRINYELIGNKLDNTLEEKIKTTLENALEKILNYGDKKSLGKIIHELDKEITKILGLGTPHHGNITIIKG